MKHLIKTIGFLLVLLVDRANADVTMRVVQVPTDPNGVFTATIAGASELDPTPNPCYRRTAGCDLRAFTIGDTWLPGGLQGYKTTDSENNAWGYEYVNDATGFPTVGSWWQAVRRKTRHMSDFLPYSDQGVPCVVLAAKTQDNNMVSASIVSNCARGYVQAKTCAIEPAQINVSLSAAKGGDVPATLVPGVSVSCDKTADVRIETMDGERIPLSGLNTSVAVLDWGAGFGEPMSLHLAAGERRSISLRVKTEGAGGLDAGVVSGSSVVNLIYD